MRLPLAYAFLGLAISFNAHADLVADWVGDDFTEGNPWVSRTGGISANIVNAPIVGETPLNGHKVVDLYPSDHFVVPPASNPLGGATSFTLVAAYIPRVLGGTGSNFWNSSGLITMEQAGTTADWALGWNGDRVAGGTGAPDRTIFSGPYPLGQLQIAIMTWNNAGQQRLYVNGVKVAEDLSAATGARNGAQMYLGGLPSESTGGINALIAELRMYNSDESANVAAITNDLLAKYAEAPILQSAGLTASTAAEIRFQDSSAFTADPAGSYTLLLNGTPIPPSSLQVDKTGSSTVVAFTNAFEANTNYEFNLTIPGMGGGSQTLTGVFPSFKLPSAIPGPAGSVGAWGIREYRINGAGDLAAALSTALDPASTPFVDATAPVFNHSDPNTNGANTVGNFNNDFPILTDTPADDNFVVVGKTQITVPAAGVYTFSVHSDDGFAMKISGPGGGRFISKGGTGAIDPADPQTIFLDGGSSDSNTRGTYQFDAAGTYDILYLGWDGTLGGYYEVAWAEGAFVNDRDTNTWKLVGNPDDPSIPAYRPRFATDLPGPLGTTGTFGIRTYLQARLNDELVNSFPAASNFLATTTRLPSDADGLTVDAQAPYLNHRDPQAGGGGLIPGDLDFPGNTSIDDNNVVTVAKGRIYIPAAGPYTFTYAGDDGFLLRLKGAGSNPNPKFRAASGVGNFQMSNPNELYFDGIGTVTARGVVDLLAGAYDVEFVQHEGGGNFYYEIASAPGTWLEATTPPGGFQLVGYQPPSSVAIPGIKEPGWTVESSNPGLTQFPNTIAGGEERIDFTLALPDVPANAITTWDTLNFRDPEDGPEGNFSPTNPWPLNTPQADDAYAMRATGTLVITEAGTYHLGFQGDDGGYLYLYGQNGTSDPVFDSIVYTNLPAVAKIDVAPGSTVRNALLVDSTTGNSRTLASVNLAVGEYRIQTLVFEGGSGSFWEVIGGQAVDSSFNYPLLAKGPGGTVTVASGLLLLGPNDPIPNEPGPENPNFNISGFTLVGNPVTGVSFSFGSESDAAYTVQGSVDLQNWITIDGNLASAGASTPVTVNLGDFPELAGQPRVFFRVVLNN